MTREGYEPYCGAHNCTRDMPRTTFNGEQFQCRCGWVSGFDLTFIKEYKEKWGLK